MSQNQLQELFHEKKQKTKPVTVDWAAKRDGWIAAVKALYLTIVDDYLKAAKEDVEIEQFEQSVIENRIGEYRIPKLILRVGDEEVVFSPKGANVVGAQGRIDVEGERGYANIIWQGEDRWSIVVARTPSLRLLPLTADSLAEMLRGIMRP